MKIFASLFLSFALAASSDFWVNNYDKSARIPCGDLASLENVQQLSWIKKNKAGSVEIAELINENGEIKDDEKVAGFRIDTSGALVISKLEKEEFSLQDIANYICRANLRSADGRFDAKDSTTKLLVNFVIDKENLEPIVRDKRLGEDESKKYKEGVKYEIAECESREAGPDAPVLRWIAFDSSGEMLADSNAFGACKTDDSNFCGKTNDFFDKQDGRQIQTTTLPLAFDADNLTGISAKYDQAYFQCEATYKEAWNGMLVEVIKTKRWPAGDDVIRVIAPVRSVDILVNGVPVNAGVLDVTFGAPFLQCRSDGFDNKAENELEEKRSRAGEYFKFACKSRNALNDGKWVEKEFVFTEATLEKPVAEFSHDGLVAELNAKSSPTAAMLTFTVYQCPANEIELKKPGTKENREMFKNFVVKCIKAKTYGNKHYIDKDVARENPTGFAVAILAVKDVHENEEMLFNYAPLNQSGNRRFSNEEEENFPIQAWFDKMGAHDSFDIVAFYFNEEEKSVYALSSDSEINEENDEQFHVVVEPSPTEAGKYVLCYDFADKIDLNSFNDESYESIREKLRNEHADFCRFFVKKDSFPWWIIIVVLVLLILIAALVFFIIE
ncbi:unnamed protein product [Oikopleura dioica]|uniref:Ig-like domain-containing protein n=1 Tax=Oikopleura dioica TaxID=34765 RepID=E4XLN6_OIKDI|nr:unnamed protein product [Oikopleura dioica]